MSVTMFLSMWISNTAAMALMVPIVDSITEAMSSDDDDENDEKSDKDKVRNYFLLSCAYAANMGGTGVITGMTALHNKQYLFIIGLKAHRLTLWC